nr:hypothetical protein [Curtobacterium sp. PhB78]
MAVGVVRADADESDTGRELPVQQRVLVGRTVVRDLHDVDGVCWQRTAGADPTLRGLPQVTEEHPGQARRAVGTWRRLGDEHDARVVAGVRAARARPHHTPTERPEHAGHPVVGLPDVGATALQVLHDAAVRRTADRSDERRVDDARDLVDRPDVVAVEVREDEQVDPADPQQVEARPEAVRVVPGVNQGRAVAATDQHGVTLSDVARRDRPVARDGTAHDQHRNRDGGDTDHDDDSRDEQQAAPRRRSAQHGDREAPADDHGADHSDGPTRPRRRRVRQQRCTVGDAPDRRRGGPGDGCQHRPTPRPDRREQTRTEADDGDDRYQGLGQQVRRHRVGRQRRGQRDRHGPAGDLCCHRHGEGGGRRGPQPSGEEPGERWPEHHDAGRGEHRQREPERPREPGVDHQHADRGQGDEGHAAHGAAGQVHDQHDDRHHRGPNDRRVWPHEHHEREQHGDGRRRPEPPRHPAESPDHHDEADDHRAVRPGYSC